ncbi:MAG: ParB/Srx family N-terminal domain-containing protein, partial [Pseudomonadota bacterium]|nr:ParB/Srx family N-terminal domain-containing protein [Pseudomonadota bacterium]
MNTLAVEYRLVETLIPFVRNPRTHSEAQVAKIAASIVEFGFTNPLLVDGDNGIICGHGRLAAARKLGLAEVPVIELGHLSPTQKRAYVIGDNQLALQAGWDEELLALELTELQEAGYDLLLTGFDDAEIERLWANAVGVEEAPDSEPTGDVP